MQRLLALQPGHQVSRVAGPLLLQVHPGRLFAAGGGGAADPASGVFGRSVAAGLCPSVSGWVVGLVWLGISHRAATFHPGKRGSSSGSSLVSWRMTTCGFWSSIRFSSSVRRGARLLQFSCNILSSPDSGRAPRRVACRPGLLTRGGFWSAVGGIGAGLFRVRVGVAGCVGLPVGGAACASGSS